MPGRSQGLLRPRTLAAFPPDIAPAPAKVLRDGFTMPADDYALIAQLQATGLAAGLAVSNSAVLRAGLHALKALSPDARRQVFAALEKVKPGRPPKR